MIKERQPELDWLCQETTGESQDIKTGEPGEIIPEGKRNSWLFHRASGYRAKGDSEDVIFQKVKTAFIEHPNWARSEKEQRELRQKVTFAIFAIENDLDRVAAVVDHLFNLLMRAQGRKA